MASRKTTPDTISVEEAKRRFLEARSQGLSVPDSAHRALRTEKTYEYWRKTDAAFREKADHATELWKTRQGELGRKDISFEEFSEKYLGQKVYWHQLQWVDIIEGREPRDLHPSETYEPNNPRFLLFNTPPHHAKTTTLTVNYSIYRLCMEAGTRIKFVSKTQNKAREFLQEVKMVLTGPDFVELQTAYGPQGGWGKGTLPWRADYIYLERDGKQKDPSVEALGIGGHIYGSRANLIFLDDVVETTNAHEWEKQLNWLQKMVKSRVGKFGKIVVVGTRVESIDLYRQLREGNHFSTGKSPYTYFSQPAVLEYADDPAEWKTLWPKSHTTIEPDADVEETPDENGLYVAWDGPALAEVREGASSKDWALVYMQQDVIEQSAFPQYAVHGSCNGMREVGVLQPQAPGHRKNGMDGLTVIGSMDPSGSGQSAFVVYAFDRETRKRYVLQAKTLSPWSWPVVSQLVKDWTDEFGIREWVCEKNMYHTAFRHNAELSAWLQDRGVRVVEHYTQNNKHDVDMGVMSLAPLFGEWKMADDNRGAYVKTVDPLIELPKRHAQSIVALCDQLITWHPETKNKTDLVMALWFAELRVRALLPRQGSQRPTHQPNRFASRRALRGRGVVNLRDYAQGA